MCSLLLKFGEGISFLKSQESYFKTEYYCKGLFTYSLKSNQLQIGLWKNQQVNIVYGAVSFSYTKAKYQYNCQAS